MTVLYRVFGKPSDHNLHWDFFLSCSVPDANVFTLAVCWLKEKRGPQDWAQVQILFPCRTLIISNISQDSPRFQSSLSLGVLPPSFFTACYKNQGKFIATCITPKIICLGKKGIDSDREDSNLSCKFVIPTREPLWCCRTCRCCMPNSRHFVLHVVYIINY